MSAIADDVLYMLKYDVTVLQTTGNLDIQTDYTEMATKQ